MKLDFTVTFIFRNILENVFLENFLHYLWAVNSMSRWTSTRMREVVGWMNITQGNPGKSSLSPCQNKNVNRKDKIR